jgi:hypothetical protein
MRIFLKITCWFSLEVVMKAALIAVSIFLFFAGEAFAYRPFTTEDAGVAGKGVLQTEISYDYFKWQNGHSDQILLFVTPIYGAAERLELSVETPLVIHKDTESTTAGVGDINLVGKYVLLWDNYETKDGLLTLKGLVKLNSGDFEKNLGRGDTEYSLFPVFSKIINEDLTVHAQLGYTFVTDKENPDLRNYYFYGGAIDYALTKPLHAVAEFTGNQNPDRTQQDQMIALAGFTYTLSKQVIVDATYKKGFGPASPQWGAGVGVAIEF